MTLPVEHLVNIDQLFQVALKTREDTVCISKETVESIQELLDAYHASTYRCGLLEDELIGMLP